MIARTLVLAAVVLAPALSAQSIERRIGAAPDGLIRVSFTAREGVCGNGDNISTRSSREDGWQPDCQRGPVRLALTKRDGQITKVRVHVGGVWTEVASRVTDLGQVSAPDAAAWCLDVAERGSISKEGRDLIFAATLADSVKPWPRLLRIARNQSLDRETRRGAVFWLGQAAGDEATKGLTELVDSDNESRDVQDAAVFALSQQRDGAGVTALIKTARTHKDPQIRKKALFWLGQSDDPRAIALFEELLTKR